MADSAFYDDDPEGEDVQQSLSPEELERSQRLFEKLAAEEPPLNASDDTAAGKTAPRQAIITDDTRPIQAFAQGRQYLLTLGVGVFLAISLVVTLMLFISGGDEDEAPKQPQATSQVALNSTQTPSPTATTEVSIQVEQPASATPVPQASPTNPVTQFLIPLLPPTALPEERNAWALTPIAPPPPQMAAGVIRQDEAFTVAGASTRLEVIPYVVQSGDTLTSVADQFDLDVCSLVWSNPRHKVSPMRPGYVLDILPVDGVLYTVDRSVTPQQIAETTQVDVYTILDSPYNPILTNAKADSPLPTGMKVVVPNGTGGDCNVWSAPSTVSGSDPGGGGGSGGGGSLWGCAYGVEAGGFAGITPVGGNYTFFQGFSLAHTGVDLAAPTGTSVLAAGAGAVAYAGWNEYGYGNVIVIDHGGIYSLYAHLSQINVSCGQQVGAGSVIGAIGSTGRSSGPHLHFEVRDAGFNPVDPSYSIAL